MSTPEFYREARAYDIAFGDRDFNEECDFLEWCLRQHGVVQGDSNSFLELAAGPARHARVFARRGWRSVALDLSDDMLDYAQQGARREGVSLELVKGDMCDFALQKPIALAANLMESLSHLTTNEQVAAHLRAVSRNLLPGGIFLIEMAHPADIWRDNLPNYWTLEEDGTSVDMIFGLAEDHYDWISQQWTVTTQLIIREPGQPQRVIRNQNQHRWYQPQELRALIELSGAFSQSWWYGNMLVPPPSLNHPEDAERMIVVLRK